MNPHEAAAFFWIRVGLGMSLTAIWFLFGWWGFVLLLGVTFLAAGLDSL